MSDGFIDVACFYLYQTGAAAINGAIADAGVTHEQTTGLFVGNMLSGMLSKQQHLGPLLSYEAGLRYVHMRAIISLISRGANRHCSYG